MYNIPEIREMQRQCTIELVQKEDASCKAELNRRQRPIEIYDEATAPNQRGRACVMAPLTHDLGQSKESRKRRFTPAEICSLWRSAPYKLAFNELSQEVELDQASLPVVEIEEAYIGLFEKGYNADPRTTSTVFSKLLGNSVFIPFSSTSSGLKRMTRSDRLSCRSSVGITSVLAMGFMTRCGQQLYEERFGECSDPAVSSISY